MNNLQKSLIISLISVSALSWATSRIYQVDMMTAMMAPFSPLAVSLFVAVWTAGMAAMMFPAISPVVLLYNKLIRTTNGSGTIVKGDPGPYFVKMVLFIGSYLAVWSATGFALLMIWSLQANLLIAPYLPNLSGLYGAILVAAGAYQFSPLKSKCLGYCESPMSLFMRRWRKGTAGAVSMGTYQGLYCLGCCWPYFLIMVALGWMDIIWMALFAGIIFGEKMWAKGICVARTAGICLAVVGALSIAGVIQLAPLQDNVAVLNETSMGVATDDLGAGISGEEISHELSRAVPTENSSVTVTPTDMKM